MNGVVHRIPIPRGAALRVEIGDMVKPDQLLAVNRSPGHAITVDVAGRLGRSAAAAGELLVAHPGSRLEAGEVIARSPQGAVVSAPVAGLLVGYSRNDGTALLAPLGEEVPVIGHVSGRVQALHDGAIDVEVRGAQLLGVGGTGEAVHGELVVAVRDPAEELRATAIDVGATGKILVGGSRASAETLTRARAMGVAGIILGGVLDKELRDFEAIQRRRREIGGLAGSFGLVLLEGFGKVGFDPQLFEWFKRHAGHLASIFGAQHRAYVYDAAAAPRRTPQPAVGDRVIAHRRPFQGRGGVLVAVLDDLHATPSGLMTRMGLVRFEDGRLAPVPLANMESTAPAPAPASDR